MSNNDKTSVNKDLVLSSYIKLMRAADSITNRSHRHLAEALLSFSQFAVIEALYDLGPLRQRGIDQKNLDSPSNITTVVDNLVKRKLVLLERDTGDGRFLNVHITGEDRDLYLKALF